MEQMKSNNINKHHHQHFPPLLHNGLDWWLISVQHKVSPCATGVAHLLLLKAFE